MSGSALHDPVWARDELSIPPCEANYQFPPNTRHAEYAGCLGVLPHEKEPRPRDPFAREGSYIYLCRHDPVK